MTITLKIPFKCLIQIYQACTLLFNLNMIILSNYFASNVYIIRTIWHYKKQVNTCDGVYQSSIDIQLINNLNDITLKDILKV